MKNWTFKKWNTILGWAVFAIAFFTYLSTIEPNFSFWDCGEYISSAVKLQVTHAPGAALFQLLGAVAAIFGFGDPTKYSVIINAMSALFSAFTILFLFWTITHFVRRLLNKDFEEVTFSDELAILFSGTVGALAFTFSDTFWFSAVEGEVYSMASMFIALMVWLITKWENEYHAIDNERWLILIFFITGLSVGVHMMVMLAIPAVCLVYYARNYEFTWKNFAIANLVTLLILAIVFKVIFPLIMTLFGKSEIFFVNGLGLPFHSGTIVAFVILFLAMYFALTYARKSKSKLFQTIALSVIYMIIGFSCWLVIPIRANANPPMNLNDPDNAIGMLDYYNREQYGDWPTMYGQNYTAYLDNYGIEKNDDGSYKTQKTGDIYEKNEKTGRYDIVGERFNYVYSKEHVGFLPRMFNEDETVMSNYITMYGAPDFEFNYDNEEMANNPKAKEVFDGLRQKFNDGSITLDDYKQAREYDLIKVHKPTLSQNISYLFTFQSGYYFVRYLFWNFVGKQNDLEGHMENTNGNWVSGIPAIDDTQWGSQKDMPAKFHNESTVYFFFLPLILGLLGAFFQFNKDFGRFWAILSLFVLTSFGIIFYTGVKPFEVRERDYAMVGSFYAFAIWIGFGAASILWYLQEKLKSNAVTWIMGIILLAVPLMMGFPNYRSHDRSERYTAYDFSYSSLKSLPKNDIFFVYGDNDTYPIWAIQETNQFRDDVKVVNFTLLGTPWNIDQVKRRTYNAMPVPSILTHDDYRDGTNDQIVVLSADDWKNFIQNNVDQGIPESMFAPYKKYITQDSMNIKEAVNFLKKKSPEKDEILKLLFGEEKFERFNFLPVSKFVLPVNKTNAVKSGIISAKDLPNAVDHITINYKKSSMFKADYMMMDILANFDWKRPINFSVGGIYENQNLFYLQNYLQYDGFSYRLVPVKTEETESGDMGRVVADDLYKIVKNYRWGNFKNLNAHFDETCTQNIVSYRSSASRAADALVLEGKKAKAVEILDLASREIPSEKFNDPRSLSAMIYGYIVAGQEQKGLKLAEQLKRDIFQEYDYYASLDPKEQRFVKKQMSSQPILYSIVISAVSDAYKKIGQKDKGYAYLVKSIDPIDKRFKNFIADLKMMGKEKAFKESDNAQKITPFYSYIFQVMKPYDSTYANEKEAEITRQVIEATK
jgi:hypothetical protein